MKNKIIFIDPSPQEDVLNGSNLTEEQLILVDKDNQVTGTAGKMYVHKNGLLHRAFSIIIFNSKGKLLLQRRAKNKYHSGGLWANTCCGHPSPGESIIQAAERRLDEEMGISCRLEEIFSFSYRVNFTNGLSENEYDHVLVGKGDNLLPKPNPKEVDDFKWIKMETLKSDIRKNPEIYAYWFRLLIEKIGEQILK